MRLHLPDHAPIATIGPYTIIAERHEVLFRDDTTVGLHQVIENGTISRYLRCVFHGELHALIVDVRDLARSLAAELPIAQDRDVQGLVCITFRLRYSTAAEFLAAAVAMVRSAALVERQPQQRALCFLSSGPVDGLQASAERRYWAAPITSAA